METSDQPGVNPDQAQKEIHRQAVLDVIAAGQLCLALEVSWGKPMSVPYSGERGMTTINL